jgi:hypothetical protein
MKFWSYISRGDKGIRGRQIDMKVFYKIMKVICIDIKEFCKNRKVIYIDMKKKILNMKEVEFLPEKIFI